MLTSSLSSLIFEGPDGGKHRPRLSILIAGFVYATGISVCCYGTLGQAFLSTANFVSGVIISTLAVTGCLDIGTVYGYYGQLNKTQADRLRTRRHIRLLAWTVLILATGLTGRWLRGESLF